MLLVCVFFELFSGRFLELQNQTGLNDPVNISDPFKVSSFGSFGPVWSNLMSGVLHTGLRRPVSIKNLPQKET